MKKVICKNAYGTVTYDAATGSLTVRDQNNEPYPPAILEAIVETAVALANANLQER